MVNIFAISFGYFAFTLHDGAGLIAGSAFLFDLGLLVIRWVWDTVFFVFVRHGGSLFHFVSTSDVA
jgi:hypothetical protein